MEGLAEIVNGYKPLTFSTKPSILDVSEVSEYDTEPVQNHLLKRHKISFQIFGNVNNLGRL